MRKALLAFALVAAVGFAVAACSSGGGGSSGKRKNNNAPPSGGSGSGGGGGGGSQPPGGGGGSQPPGGGGGGGTPPPQPGLPQEGRALWVTRWSADTEAKVQAAVDYAVANNYNILLLQVYGDGYTLFPSSVAPRSSLVSGSGFDTLEAGIRLGHAAGLEVHAWFNVVRVYHGGAGAPSSSNHCLNLHPEWSAVRSNGTASTSLYSGASGSEIFACPEWDGFHQYTRDLVSECVRSYAVDGVHWDYIRFGGHEYCYCSEHQRKFQAAYGRAPAAGDADWERFRFETITRLVTNLYDDVTAIRPLIKVSAAVTRHSQENFQDFTTWFRSGKLDIAFPMLYTTDLSIFTNRAWDFNMASNGRLVMPGIGNAWDHVGEQIDAARQLACDGVAVFASSDADANDTAEAAARFTGPAAVPLMPWKDGSADVTPPLYSSPVLAAGIDEAWVEWSTDEQSWGRVEVWDDTTGAFLGTFNDPTFGWDHQATATGLVPQTTYRYHIVSTDAAQNWSSSFDQTFTTIANGPVDVYVDDGTTGFTTIGSWSTGSSQGGMDNDYLYASRASSETASATFRPALPRSGQYNVSTWYVNGTNRVADASYLVSHRNGTQTVVVDQQQTGRQWLLLGTFPFDTGSTGYVKLSNAAATTGVVIGDAVRFEYVGP